MNNLPQIFSNPKFGEIRTIEIDRKIHFVASDIAKALGYTNPSKAINDHCKGVTKRYIPTNGGNQEMNVIPEGDIYRLAAKSELPGAEEFESWIFDEVLPTIRKTGSYSLQVPQTFAEALRLAADLAEQKEKLQQQNAIMAPKAEFFDAVADSKDAIAIGEAAKVLNMGIGRNKLFDFLRKKKVLMKDNLPYQEFIDRGYFRTIEQKYQTPEGETKISIKTLVYQKGLDYIRRLFQDSRELAVR